MALVKHAFTILIPVILVGCNSSLDMESPTVNYAPPPKTATATDTDTQSKPPPAKLITPPGESLGEGTNQTQKINDGLAEASPSLSREQKCLEPPSPWVCEVESQIAALTNDARINGKLNGLLLDPQLAYVARLWSVEQGKRNIVSHEWLENGKLATLYTENFQSKIRLSGENVAKVPCGKTINETAEAIAKTWLNGRSYKEVIFRKEQNRVGVGIAIVGSNCFATQVFASDFIPK